MPVLQDEIRAHDEALRDVVSSATAVVPSAWNTPGADGKWSPAQVMEHLRLSYTVVSAELEGQAGFRIRTKWWQQRLFRFRFLPAILESGRFPKGVPAVREIRPGDGPFEREAVLDALLSEGERFMAAAGAASPERTRVTHPFLGKLDLLEGLRFMTQHIRHHQKQISRT